MFEEGPVYYDVWFDDNWLEVENFVSVEADDEDEARERFLSDYVEEGDEDRYEINNIEYAYTNIDIVK